MGADDTSPRIAGEDAKAGLRRGLEVAMVEDRDQAAPAVTVVLVGPQQLRHCPPPERQPAPTPLPLGAQKQAAQQRCRAVSDFDPVEKVASRRSFKLPSKRLRCHNSLPINAYAETLLH